MVEKKPLLHIGLLAPKTEMGLPIILLEIGNKNFSEIILIRLTMLIHLFLKLLIRELYWFNWLPFLILRGSCRLFLRYYRKQAFAKYRYLMFRNAPMDECGVKFPIGNFTQIKKAA